MAPPTLGALPSAAAEVSAILLYPAPFILQTSLDDYYVSYPLNAFTREAGQQAGIFSLIHQHIQAKFNEAMVKIMSPYYRVVGIGHQVTIPVSYLLNDYEVSGFRVENSTPNGPAGPH